MNNQTEVCASSSSDTPNNAEANDLNATNSAPPKELRITLLVVPCGPAPDPPPIKTSEDLRRITESVTISIKPQTIPREMWCSCLEEGIDCAPPKRKEHWLVEWKRKENWLDEWMRGSELSSNSDNQALRYLGLGKKIGRPRPYEGKHKAKMWFTLPTGENICCIEDVI